MSASKIFINQDDNHNANFGEVLRSSAIFWVKNDDELQPQYLLATIGNLKTIMMYMF